MKDAEIAIQVRLIVPGERLAWNELMREHHYLGMKALVGHSLRYVAQYEGRWLALLGWAVDEDRNPRLSGDRRAFLIFWHGVCVFR